MKKTKIAFEDIKAGDLLEVVVRDAGVKSVVTGVAFLKEAVTISPDGPEEMWLTSERGMVVAGGEDALIYRVDVAEVKFEDIQKGDRIRVTVESAAGRKTIVEDTVDARVDGMNPFWLNSGPDTVVFERFYDGDGDKRTIEILERGE